MQSGSNIFAGFLASLSTLWGSLRGGGESPRRVLGYDAGRVTRGDIDFRPRHAGPNVLADETLDLVKRRVRHLCDNNPLLIGVRNTIRNNVVGTGIGVQANTEWTELNTAINAKWKERCKAVNLARDESMAMTQMRFFDDLFSAGEIGRHLPIAPAHAGHAEGPVIDLVDCDRLPLSGYGPWAMKDSRAENGNVVRQSVEFDALGRRAGYHVLVESPVDGGFGKGSMETRRLSAMDFKLCFMPRRLNQIRGVPWAVGSVASTRMEDAFHEAYFLMARAAACVGGVIIEGVDDEELLGNEEEREGPLVDAKGNSIKRIEPGIIGYVPKGAEVKTIGAQALSPAIEQVERILQRRIAASMNISYAAVARDFSQATFAATRAEQLEDRKQYRPIQCFIFDELCAPYYERWLRWEIAVGGITLTAQQQKAYAEEPCKVLGCAAIYPGWDWVNPQQQAAAAETELKIGIVSPQTLMEEKGRDWKVETTRRLEHEKFVMEERERLGLPEPVAAPAMGNGAKTPPSDPEDPADDKPVQDKPDEQARRAA